MGFFSSHIKTFNDLFVQMLRDINYAESQIVKALPKMIDKATGSKLKQGFETHLSPIGTSFRTAWRRSKGVPCPAIDGILSEADYIRAR